VELEVRSYCLRAWSRRSGPAALKTAKKSAPEMICDAFMISKSYFEQVAATSVDWI
jgi:hypothetical protein